MKRFISIHIILFTIFPILFLYAYNIKEFPEKVIFIPLVVALIPTLFLFFLLSFILRNNIKGGILTSSIIILSYSFGRLRSLFTSLNIYGNFGSINLNPNRILVVLIIAFIIISFYIIRRSRQSFAPLSAFFNLTSTILVIITLVNIISFEITSKRLLHPRQNVTSSTIVNKDKISDLPDVYYFLIDDYAGNDTLKQYNFDNSQFIKYLTRKGFYIADKSTTNYPKTFLAIASSLNMEYLDFLSKIGRNSGDQTLATPYIQNNKVLDFFQSRGYLTINIGSWWEQTRVNKYADINLLPNTATYLGFDEFSTRLLSSTILLPVIKKINPDPLDVSVIPLNNIHRQFILYQFDRLKQLPDDEAPKFVYMQSLFAHEPWVLGPNCEPITARLASTRTNIVNYLNQLECGNKKLMEALDWILSNTSPPPIIIIQGDESPDPMKNPIGPNLNWKDASNDSLKEKFSILNAIYLPGGDYKLLYPTITPVNTFRLIFNLYYKQHLPLLPDKNYIFLDDKHFYDFIDITDSLSK